MSFEVTRSLMPGYQNSGALQSLPGFFCFNFKNELRNKEFLLVSWFYQNMLNLNVCTGVGAVFAALYPEEDKVS